MELRFVKTASAFDYLDPTVSYLERNGKPVAFVPPSYGTVTPDQGDISKWGKWGHL